MFDIAGQADLFATAPPRAPATHRRGLDTEREAAAKIAPRIARLHSEVMGALLTNGAMTDRELERLPQFDKYGPSTIRKRRSELYQAGALVAEGKRDGLTIWRAK